MGAYEYQALDLRGRTRKGVASGDTARQVRQQLREQGLMPLTVVGVEEREGSRRGSRRRIGTTDLAVITRQLATLLGSNLTIEEALDALIEQSESHHLKSTLTGIRSTVMAGGTLADAMRDFPRSFSELYTASVAAGEETGRLGEVLERLAEYTETRQGLQQRLGVALVYPIILTVVAIVIVVGLVTYVVPQVVKVFEDTGQQLPLLTRALIALSEFMQVYGVWLVAAVATAAVVLGMLLRRPHVRYQWHRLLLTLPGVRRLSRTLNSARMARTLAIMVGSGVPLLSSMRATAEVVGNRVLRQALERAAAEVAEGASVSRALRRTRRFPPLLLQMVASGESSGRLPQMLDKAATAMERELESRIAVLVGLFEPFMILVMGGIVLAIVLAILLPIFDLNQLIG